MGREQVFIALYDRVADMTVANGYNYNWQSIKSLGNGALISTSEISPVLNVMTGQESPADSPPKNQYMYSLELPVMLTGYVQKDGDSDVDLIQYDLEIVKARIISDIRRAFFIVYDELCSADAKDITYESEIEVPDGLRDAFEVEATLEYRIKFDEDGSTS